MLCQRTTRPARSHPRTPAAALPLAALIAASLMLGACTSGGGGSRSETPFSAARSPSGGLTAQPIIKPIAETPANPVEGSFTRSGDIYITGQPSEAELRQLRAEGVTLIVNLRTDKEMTDPKSPLPFDEAALARELGIEYVHIPIGMPEHPYRPEIVDQFAEALARHEGKALLHCAVAGRASIVWAGYLVRHKGMEPKEALQHAAAIRPQYVAFAELIDADVVFVPKQK